MLNFKNLQKFYLFVKSNLTLTLKHLNWYCDDVSGKPSDTQMVQAARREEGQVIQTMGVWEPIPRPKNKKVISTRWVDVNKGDEQRPKYRSRLVARELKAKSGQSETHWSDFFASMPPITALRILFTIAVTKKVPNKDGKLIPLDPTTCLIFIDIKKAYFWSPARRQLLVEQWRCHRKWAIRQTWSDCSRLRKSLYGTRDAPANWEAAIKHVMLALGFLQARSNACLYFHEERNMRIEVHGDDFTGVGPKSELEWFASELKKFWTVDLRGILGPPSMNDVSHSMNFE